MAAAVRRPASGFTLIEMLLVVVIIGILITMTVIGLRGASIQEQLDREAERLLALIELNQQAGLMRSETRGIAFTESGYDFRILENDEWAVPADDLLKPRELPAGMTFMLTVEGEITKLDEKVPDQPQVLMLPGGETTAFSAVIEGEYLRGWELRADILGRLALERVE